MGRSNLENSSIAKVIDFFKRIILYQEPAPSHRFVLPENEYDAKPADAGPSPQITKSLEELYALLRYAHRLADYLDRLVIALKQGDKLNPQLIKDYRSLLRQESEIEPIQLGYYAGEDNVPDRPVSASLEENSVILSKLYHLPQNTGVVLRKFLIAENPPLKAMLVYMDGLSDKRFITTAILKPLMTVSNLKVTSSGDVIDKIIKEGIPYGKISRLNTFEEIQRGINSGRAVLFLDGFTEVIIIDTTSWERRSVDRPLFEQTVRGAQVAFGEVLDVNIGLIRSLCRSSDLISEEFPLGSRSRLNAVIMYIESIANPTLVAEVRRRITSIKTDSITDSDVLLQMIGDHPNSPYPTSLSTERPDLVVASLAEGRIAILMEGSPFVHIAPITFFTLMQSPEDFSMKTPYSSFIRILRWLSASIALMLPALFLSLSTFHQEAIPTDLALAISVAREQVPFPTVMEILLLDITFELLREAGLRIPGILGPTIGIVGGIILGQAIVAAKIVSPIVVIVVAMTGLSSFVIPEYRLSTAIRLMRFILTGLAAFLGLVGVSVGLIVILLVLCNMKSFGVPYLAPIAPKTIAGLDVIVRGPIYRQERRPDVLQPKDIKRQPHISRGWVVEPSEGGDDA
jgi:spore germination protein KA